LKRVAYLSGPRLAIGFVAAAIVLFPWTGASSYTMTVVTFMGMFALLAIGLNVVIGNAGQASLGQAAFFGIGAYAYAILTASFGLPYWVGVLASALVPGLAGGLLGWLVLRLSGHYLAMATLAFSVIMYRLFLNLPITGGASGIHNIPVLPFAAIPGVNLPNLLTYYYVVWVVVALAAVFTAHVVHSRVGRALTAIRTDETAAAMLGINPARYKIQAFTLSAVFAGLSGALFASYQTFVGAAAFSIERSLDVLVMVVIGGLGSVVGSVLGAMVWTILPELLHASFMPDLLRTNDQLRLLANGLAVVLIVILWPTGLAGALRRLLARGRR
jgi:branched-chain amino acid transport system permease protein